MPTSYVYATILLKAAICMPYIGLLTVCPSVRPKHGCHLKMKVYRKLKFTALICIRRESRYIDSKSPAENQDLRLKV